MKKNELIFLEEIAKIQEIVVSTIYNEPNISIEKLAYSISYDTIVMLMELLDGYRGGIKINLFDKLNNSLLFESVELHDKVIEYIKE